MYAMQMFTNIYYFFGKMTSRKCKVNFMSVPSYFITFQLMLPECSTNFMSFFN